jgi:hypothetical protein
LLSLSCSILRLVLFFLLLFFSIELALLSLFS